MKHNKNHLKNKKSKSSDYDIEKGAIVIVEPIKKTPIDSLAALENEIIRSIMPISKGKAEYYFNQGNPLEREQKGMFQEDLESYAYEVNNPHKFKLGRGLKSKTRKNKKRHSASKKRRHSASKKRRHSKKQH